MPRARRRLPSLPSLPALPARPTLPALPGLPALPALPAPTVRRLTRRRPPLDPAGWNAPELAAYLALGPQTKRVLPPLRAGHAAVRALNALSGVMPTQAVLLGRAVADAAPPIGAPIAPALHDILERYLPASIEAYRVSAGRAGAGRRAETLLLDQLRLLHSVTQEVLRAQSEHDDHELRVRADFLRERFATWQGNPLDLPDVGGGPFDDSGMPPASPLPGALAAPAPVGSTTGADGSGRAGSGGVDASGSEPSADVAAPGAPSGLATAATLAQHTVRVDRHPVRVFPPAELLRPSSATTAADGRTKGRRPPRPTPDAGLTLRLAMPRGVPVVLGAAVERRDGPIEFLTNRVRGWSSGKRRAGGFAAAQVDVRLTVPTQGVRRFVVHATSDRASEPTDVVLFVADDAGNEASLPTVLARRRRAGTTVVATGFATSDGLFLRNESTFWPTLRAACDAHGLTDVVWLSDDTPAV